MKNGKLKWLFTLALLFCLGKSNVIYSQNLTLRQNLKLTHTKAVSLDRYNNIYFADRNNNVYQYNALGALLNTYSPALNGTVESIEAWNMIKVFVFYADKQQIVLLDRFLREITTVKLLEYMDGLVKVATLSSDDKYWLFNESDLTLHKLDPRFPDQRIITPLDLVLNRGQQDITYMREYQNNVYLTDRNSGIYVFDNLGNYQKKLPIKNLDFLGFRNDELYYLQNSQIRFYHLYNFKERVIDLPPGKTYKQALVGEKLVYLLTDAEIDVYDIE